MLTLKMQMFKHCHRWCTM